MANELTQLFELWETVKYLDETKMINPNFIEQWDQLCWQIQVLLILDIDRKTSYLNAIAALSDRIFERYIHNRRGTFLKYLLNKLGILLEDREKPEKYRQSILKITLIDSANSVAIEFSKFQIQDDFLNMLKSVLKDISNNYGPSLNLIKYLHTLTGWLKFNKTKTSEVLIHHLITVDFNHPVFVDYVFNLNGLPNLEDLNAKDLIKLQQDLSCKQLPLELIILKSSPSLIKGIDSVATKLHALLTTEIKWVSIRLNNLLHKGLNQVESNLELSSPMENLTPKKLISKWPSEKSDLVELSYGLYIYMRARGSQVTIAALIKWFEDGFGVNLARYSHRFAEIKMRKSTRPSKFLDAMVNEFLTYAEEGIAYEPDITRQHKRGD